VSRRAAARLYFSLRSPYSWLSLERLRRALPDIEQRVDFIPYWDPDALTREALQARDADFHYIQMSKAKHLYLLQDTKRLARSLGVTMRWPIDLDPWWEVPHLAWLSARRQGTQQTLFTALTEARWGRAENICDPDVLRAVADGVGLDGAALAGAVHDPVIRADGVECLYRAYHDDVFGIPYFRVGRHRFWGYDRVDDFLQELAAGPGPIEDPPVPVSYPAGQPHDTDTVGGCG
jgi:2-hydroxychromene-2-carboxylate isomerase